MAYGHNFGMRSFENVVRDGRFRVPATGTPLVIGSAVTIDPANPGYVVQAAAAAVPNPASGIVVFEHIQNKSDGLTTDYDSPYDSVPLGVYAQLMHGPGTKVWFKNTASKTLYDGRVRAAFTFVNGTIDNTAIGLGIAVAASGKWVVGAVGATTWAIVEQV